MHRTETHGMKTHVHITSSTNISPQQDTVFPNTPHLCFISIPVYFVLLGKSLLILSFRESLSPLIYNTISQLPHYYFGLSYIVLRTLFLKPVPHQNISNDFLSLKFKLVELCSLLFFFFFFIRLCEFSVNTL